MEDLDELVRHVASTTRLGPAEAARVVAEVVDFFSEQVEDFVVRRHGQLQGRNLRNPAIFEQIACELETRRFPAPDLSERKIRRIVYG